MDKIKKHKYLISFLALLVVWASFFIFVDPSDLVSKIGVENTYVVAFLLAVFGGLSTITGSSFFAAVATFAANGSNPLILALVGGLGIFISDTVFFLLARSGVEAFRDKSGKFSEWLVWKMKRLPDWAILTVVYLYIGFSPLPNDILMIALALTRMTYWRLAPVLLAGSITVVAVTAYLGHLIF